MHRMKLAAVVTAALTLLVTALALWAAPAGATHVEPIYMAGNPTCAGLGYDFGFKPQPEPPPSGTYTFPDDVNTVTIISDGTYFDWTSTLGIDAVIVKGGPNANVYVYDPPTEEFSDTGLHSPINPGNNQPYAISHIEFCYDYELTASKTADATYTRTYTWTIDKSVDPDSHSGFAGDSFSSDYDVVVDQTVTDSDFAVSGSITVNNPTPFTVGFSVSDFVDGTEATVENCGTYELAPGASTTCDYNASLGGAVDGTNTATITSNNADVHGATASADYDFGDPTTIVGYPTVNVSDSVQGPLGSASGDKTFEYSDGFECPTDTSLYTDGVYSFEAPNTATIDETGQSDDANVTVTCYILEVTKDASTSFDRTWNWTIDKSADQTDLLLSEGQLFQVNYQVMVNATNTDSNWAVSGNISVHNPAPIDATINGVADEISGFGAAAVDCDVTFPYTLGGGQTLNCTYSANLPDGSDRTNTAAATLQNAPSGTTDFSGTADVTFGEPANETDECVDVSDTNVGFLGTVCAGDAPQTFNYPLWFGAHPDADVVLECGDNSHTNTASFVANDTGAPGSDDWTVNANVACGQGCTLTPGYWKTHSEFGPAPEDEAWFSLGPLGANETFFLSGQTYYDVLWTSPSGGNVYYILAHAYIAAKLNILNGASSTPDVDAALAAAETFFNTYTPATAADLKGPDRNGAIQAATTLDEYNNGITGPGHCSE